MVKPKDSGAIAVEITVTRHRVVGVTNRHRANSPTRIAPQTLPAMPLVVGYLAFRVRIGMASRVIGSASYNPTGESEIFTTTLAAAECAIKARIADALSLIKSVNSKPSPTARGIEVLA
jgi:hypothetical protein